MRTCRNCFKHMEDDVAFCPYCGTKVYNTPVPVSTVSDTPVVRKPVSRKKIILAVIAGVLLLSLSLTFYISEIKIYKAKKLYAEGEYYQAYDQVRNIPSLGRENVIRIKAAYWASDYYESYLITKRIRLAPSASRSKDAYQDALFELTFGLYLNLRSIERDELNDIELDEYEKFNDLIYSELWSTFNMTKSEARAIAKMYTDADGVNEMHEIANTWLDIYFFD